MAGFQKIGHNFTLPIVKNGSLQVTHSSASFDDVLIVFGRGCLGSSHLIHSSSSRDKRVVIINEW